MEFSDAKLKQYRDLKKLFYQTTENMHLTWKMHWSNEVFNFKNIKKYVKK